jgi:hypothetical protein
VSVRFWSAHPKNALSLSAVRPFCSVQWWRRAAKVHSAPLPLVPLVPVPTDARRPLPRPRTTSSPHVLTTDGRLPDESAAEPRHRAEAEAEGVIRGPQPREGGGWITMGDGDADWNVRFEWERVGIAYSVGTCTWFIPAGVRAKARLAKPHVASRARSSARHVSTACAVWFGAHRAPCGLRLRAHFALLLAPTAPDGPTLVPSAHRWAVPLALARPTVARLPRTPVLPCAYRLRAPWARELPPCRKQCA